MDITLLWQLAVLAFLIQSIVQTLKPIWEPQKRTVEFYASLITSLLIAVALNVLAGLDLFSMLGIPLSVPIVGPVATGILLSNGAGSVHDILKGIQDWRYRLTP